MEIKLKTGGSLEFNPDFKLGITLNNPMLTEQASMSIPAALPLSDNNRRLLGFPDLWNKTNKQKTVFDAQIESGVYQKPALLRLTTPPGKGTDATLYLNESEMYAKMKEVELSQAFNIVRPASDFYVSGTFAEPLDMMIKYMELVMVGSIKDDFLLFPVATDYFNEDLTSTEGTVNYTFYQVLNEQYSALHPIASDMDTDLDGKPYFKLSGRVPHYYYESGQFVNVPKGYSIAPFLKQSYVLRRIFEYFGYQLKESVFDTDPEMQKIVVLNNTADAICNSQLKYSQLVPTVKISEYLQSVRTDYGCEFFISPDHKYVEVKLWNDILGNKDFVPLDSKIAGKEVPTYVSSKMLKLTGSRSIEYASSNFDTLEKFESEKGPLTSIQDIVGNETPGYYFLQRFGQIWEMSLGEAGHSEWRYNSQYLFDHYHEKEDSVSEDYEAKDSKREYIAFVRVFIRYFRIDTMLNPGYYSDMLYIGSRRHLNTTVKKMNGAGESTDESVENRKESVECPIMTAFYRGRASTLEEDYEYKVIYGNIHRYSRAEYGAPYPGGFDLILGGENGLYNKFWKLYADVIRHSFNQITIPLHFDIRDIMSFRFDKIYMLNNQPLLPEKLEFTIDEKNNVKVNTGLFRTIRLYKDLSQ